jgi:hypothetical protein
VDVSLSQLAHGMVGMIKYLVALVVLVVVAKMLPLWLSHTCYIDTEDQGMREALGKTTLKLPFNHKAWNESELRRGDIVIISQPRRGEGEESRRDFPFRIVAVAGDTIESVRGVHTVNGREEKYEGIKLVPDGATTVRRRQVPRGYVYALPDDRVSNKGGHPGLIPTWRVAGKAQLE